MRVIWERALAFCAASAACLIQRSEAPLRTWLRLCRRQWTRLRPLADNVSNAPRLLQSQYQEAGALQYAQYGAPTPYHSWMASGVGYRYTEYVVFHSDLTYPEYLLAFQRA